MLVHRPRRPFAKLTVCLACATLASCELPHAIAADQPFTPVLASPTRPPVVMVLTAPIPLPRWVEAASAAPSTPRFQSNGSNSGTAPPVFSISLEPPATAAPTPSPVPTSDAPPPTPAVVVAEAPTAAPEAPRTAPPSAITQATPDPVIQISPPTYFNRPQPAIPQVTLPSPQPQPQSVRSASATTSPAQATTSPTTVVPPTATTVESPAVAPVTTTDASSQKTAKVSTPAPVEVAPAPHLATALPGLPAVPAKTIDNSAAAAAIAAPVTPTRTAPPAAVAATSTAPSPSLQITGGRFAGMPLPNLPPLTPEPDPTSGESASSAKGSQTARNEDALSARPAAAASSAADETAAAQAELRRASERTGLTALQLAQIEESRRLIEEGNAALALKLTRKLNVDLDAASTTYIVKGSENLWQIAELPEVYGNAYLWPLILRANTKLKQPGDVQPGMRLRIPTHPAVLDVTAAIDYARRAGGEKMQPVSAGESAP